MVKERGMTVVEALVVVAILGLLAAVAASELFAFRRTVDLQRLAKQLQWDIRQCRTAAIVSGRNVGLIFARERDRWYYCIVEDRDRDGVSRRDFLAGIDVALGPRTWLEFDSGGVRLGVPAGWEVPDPSGDGLLPPDDGLRIGDAAVVAFTPQATATPSSVYFNDGKGHMLALRNSGQGGRTRTLEWRRGWRSWHELDL